MNKTHSIKRGVSLYSFQEEYFLRKMTIEDLISTTARLGIPGIEIVGDQMIPGYPLISDAFLKDWDSWRNKYGFTPVCLDVFLDWNKYKGRMMTKDEMNESVTLDIVNARKLGCPIIMIHGVPLDSIEVLARTAEKYSIKLTFEVHPPNHLDSPSEQRLIELFERLQSPFLGFTIDMGIFCKHLPSVIIDRCVRHGMKKSIADYLAEGYETGIISLGTHNDAFFEKILQMGGTQNDIYLAKNGTHLIFSNPRRLLDYMPYILHCHGKFWEMLPDYTEVSIPYQDITSVLIEGGYSGYIDSEYEGFEWISDVIEVDSAEQVRRHQVMLKHLLGEK